MNIRVPRVLVLDDLSDWQATVGGLLRDNGFTVVRVASRAAARAELEKGKFDVAVLDMRLDESDETNTEGLDVATEIKQKWPDTKVIILTGYGTPETSRRALGGEEGPAIADEFLEKDNTVSIIERIKELSKPGT